MTKTELIKTIESYHLWKGTTYPLYHCKAEIISPRESNRIFVLRSYRTIVAVADCDTQKVYQFDWYSQTTCKHVSKFVQWLNHDKYYGSWKKVPIYDASCYRAGELRTHISCDWADLLEGVTL